MSFTNEPKPPLNHPITPAQAKEMIAGDLGKVQRDVLANCVAPIYWHGPTCDGNRRICSSGTLTFVQTSDQILGVTAAHVLKAYNEVMDEPGVRCQLMNEWFEPEIIDLSDALDLATVSIPAELMQNLGKTIVPVTVDKHDDVPQEGRGIMLCGYPGQDRKELSEFVIEWGLFTALGVARRVNDRQVTWIPDREHNVPTERLDIPTPNKDLGGISGGPLIAWYETPHHVTYYGLAGIVVEANAALENVAAIRSKFIRADGTNGRG